MGEQEHQIYDPYYSDFEEPPRKKPDRRPKISELFPVKESVRKDAAITWINRVIKEKRADYVDAARASDEEMANFFEKEIDALEQLLRNIREGKWQSIDLETQDEGTLSYWTGTAEYDLDLQRRKDKPNQAAIKRAEQRLNNWKAVRSLIEAHL